MPENDPSNLTLDYEPKGMPRLRHRHDLRPEISFPPRFAAALVYLVVFIAADICANLSLATSQSWFGHEHGAIDRYEQIFVGLVTAVPCTILFSIGLLAGEFRGDSRLPVGRVLLVITASTLSVATRWFLVWSGNGHPEGAGQGGDLCCTISILPFAGLTVSYLDDYRKKRSNTPNIG